MRLWQTGMGARGKVGGDGQRGGQEAADGEGRSPAGQCEARWASGPHVGANKELPSAIAERLHHASGRRGPHDSF